MPLCDTLLYLTISYFPDFLYIFQNIEIILRHLAAYDEQTVIIGAADDTSFQHIVIRESEIMDSDSDRGILALGEDIVCRKESKAVGTDIIHGGRIFRIRIFELDGAGIVQIHTGVFMAVIDPGSGINDDLKA